MEWHTNNRKIGSSLVTALLLLLPCCMAAGCSPAKVRIFVIVIVIIAVVGKGLDVYAKKSILISKKGVCNYKEN